MNYCSYTHIVNDSHHHIGLLDTWFHNGFLFYVIKNENFIEDQIAIKQLVFQSFSIISISFQKFYVKIRGTLNEWTGNLLSSSKFLFCTLYGRYE